MVDSKTQLKQTCLYPEHIKLAARMVDFAGWSMPLNYQSQVIEHQAVRDNAGIFDVSHMQVIDLTGQKTKAMLSYLLANDINKIKKSQAIYSPMCNHQGGIIDDLIAYFVDDYHYRLVVNAGCAEKDFNWISEIAASFDVAVQRSNNLAILALQGPKSEHYLIDFLSQSNPDLVETIQSLKPFYFYYSDQLMIAKTGYTGEKGFECILSFDLAIQFWQLMVRLGVSACGLASRDSLRLEAGYPLYGNDLDENHSPIESGLGWCTSLGSERDFIGKKSILKRKEETEQLKLSGIILQEKGMIRSGQTISIAKPSNSKNPKNNQGLITSGGYSPILKQSIGFARVPVGSLQQCQVKVRDKILNAILTPTSFVKNGKAQIEINKQ